MIWFLVHFLNPVSVGLAMFTYGLIVTIGAMFFIGRVFENRWLPLRPTRQFLSFFPGDIFLSAAFGIFAAGLTYVKKPAWYNTSPIWFGIVFVISIVVSLFLTLYVDPKSHDYPKRAIWSPTKIYHNFGLYVFFGSLASSTAFVDVVGGAPLWLNIAGFVTVAPWVIANLVEDNIPVKGQNKIRAGSAHVADWHPFWVKPTQK